MVIKDNIMPINRLSEDNIWTISDLKPNRIHIGAIIMLPAMKPMLMYNNFPEFIFSFIVDIQTH